MLFMLESLSKRFSYNVLPESKQDAVDAGIVLRMITMMMMMVVVIVMIVVVVYALGNLTKHSLYGGVRSISKLTAM